MPTYAYKWENRNVTIVHAADRRKAVELLDELAKVQEKDLIRVKAPILFTLRGKAAGEWENVVEGLGEELDVEMGDLVHGRTRFGDEKSGQDM